VISDEEAKRVASPELLKEGRYPGRIKNARERWDQYGKPMIELTVIVGEGRELFRPAHRVQAGRG
jgi:hypothetical protein